MCAVKLRAGLVLFAIAGVGCGSAETPAVVDPGPVADEDDGPTDNIRGTAFEDSEDDRGDGLEIESTKGHLDPDAIQAGVAPHTSALTRCYKSGVRKARYVDGKVELKYVVDQSGTVTQVQLLKSDLGAWPIERCLLQVSREMTFSKPRGRGDADFTIPLDFSAQARVKWLSEEEAAAQVAEQYTSLSECSEGEPPADVLMTLYVGRRGKVQSVGFAATAEPFTDEWADCAEAKVKEWRLADPRGRIAKLTYRLE